MVAMKAEPWSSVRVTCSIPREAVKKLKDIAKSNSIQLHELGLLAVQVEGENTIKLTTNDEGGQQFGTHQYLSGTLPQAGMLDTSALHLNQTNTYPRLPEPTNPAPKAKRIRKPKDKSAKSKSNQAKITQSNRLQEQFMPPSTLPTNDLVNQTTSHFPITQLSPSVEQMVTEAWDQEMPLEEDIMQGVQLQSLHAETSVTTGSNQMIPNSPAAFDHSHQPQHITQRHLSQGMSPGHSNSSFDPSNMLQIMQHRPDIQKQQSVPNNFAPVSLSGENKMFVGQSIGAMQGTNMNQMPQDQPHFNQQLANPGGMEPNYIQPQANNMHNNFRINAMSAPSPSPHHGNVAQTNWPNNSLVSSPANAYKLPGNANMPGPNFPSSNNQPEMMPGTPVMKGQDVMSPGSSVHSQFPFAFPNHNKGQQGVLPDMRSDNMQSIPQGMSMDSPILVNLLQNEQSAGIAAVSNPTQSQFPSTPAPANQKPKRKKQSRKKKPPKSSTVATPTAAAPIQSFNGPYGMAGQFINQPFPGNELQNQEQSALHQASLMKMNYQDSKVSVIETISRSDVGSQAIPFSGNMAVSSTDGTLRSVNQQLPMLRRQNSMPVPGNGAFPQGLDPSKPGSFQHKQIPNMSSQQQMYINQMPGQYNQFDPNQAQRQMMLQQMQPQQGIIQQPLPSPKNLPQFQPGNFQQAMPQVPMMQQNANCPQQYQVTHDSMLNAQQITNSVIPGMPSGQTFMNNHQIPNNLNNNNSRLASENYPQQINQGMNDIKHSVVLPTLPPAHPRPTHVSHSSQVTVNSKSRRQSTVGRLANGSMSIIMKRPCSSLEQDRHSDNRPITSSHTTAPQQSRTNNSSNVSRKSPGSSAESVSFGTPSPKVSHSNIPSPHVSNAYTIGSPSLVGTHNSRSGTPKSRPQSRSSVSSKSATNVSRHSLVEQYGSPAPTPTSYGSGNSTPTNALPMPPSFHYPDPANKQEASFTQGEFPHSHGGYWPQHNMMHTQAATPYSWQGRPNNFEVMQQHSFQTTGAAVRGPSQNFTPQPNSNCMSLISSGTTIASHPTAPLHPFKHEAPLNHPNNLPHASDTSQTVEPLISENPPTAISSQNAETL